MKTTPGAQEYRKTQKRISRALLKLNFTDGQSTEISLFSPYDSVLGNLINIYNFFAAQADANISESA